jgi:formylglycine-generating enzyme required for sulfatase activity/predicted Ser/Thr protein kinase
MEDLIGQTLDRYVIEEELGRGGMAIVYRAYQPQVDREVAVKVLPRPLMHEPGFLSRFEQEAKAIASLTHPHIVPIYDYGEDEGWAYIVMAYLEGGTLADCLDEQKGKPLPIEQVAFIITQIALALDYAHRNGIIHRDVKPSNIIFDRDNNAYLSDFGLAKVAEGITNLTGSRIVGTPAYMAPEQSDPEKKVSHACDLYALGVVAYEALVGRVPYEGSTPVKQLVAHLTQPVPSARDSNPNLPEQVDAALARALAKDPADRFLSAREMAMALQAAVAPALRRGATELLSPASMLVGEPVASPVDDPEADTLAASEVVVEPVEMERQPFEPEMIPIPGGPFIMGSDTAGDEYATFNEQPQHEVMLPTYYIARCPITVGQYRVFVESGGYHEYHYWTKAGWQWRVDDRIARRSPRFWGEALWTGDDDLPVVGISWFEAYAYCQWLAEVTGRLYRLPTEEEWEKAARGTDRRIYPWGSEPPTPQICNTFGCLSSTSPVGRYSPAGDSPYGLCDASGNVWEWCQTKWYQTYDQEGDNSPEGKERRIMRGGSWFSDGHLARVTHRGSGDPGDQSFDFGFRVALSALK